MHLACTRCSKWRTVPKSAQQIQGKPPSPRPPLQDLGAWTLLGEYCGVWDRSEALDARTAEDPLGLGTLRQDRVVELGYTTSDARPGVEKGWCPGIAAASALEHACCLAPGGHASRWAALEEFACSDPEPRTWHLIPVLLECSPAHQVELPCEPGPEPRAQPALPHQRLHGRARLRRRAQCGLAGGGGQVRDP